MFRFLINWRNARHARKTLPELSDDIARLAAAVDRGTDCWVAREPGECVACGHEWIAGEIIGPIYTTYTREGVFCPATRRGCCVCVEIARIKGDPSLSWAVR